DYFVECLTTAQISLSSVLLTLKQARLESNNRDENFRAILQGLVVLDDNLWAFVLHAVHLAKDKTMVEMGCASALTDQEKQPEKPLSLSWINGKPVNVKK